MQRMIVRQPHVKMEACVSINYITTAACVSRNIQEQRKLSINKIDKSFAPLFVSNAAKMIDNG